MFKRVLREWMFKAKGLNDVLCVKRGSLEGGLDRQSNVWILLNIIY